MDTLEHSDLWPRLIETDLRGQLTAAERKLAGVLDQLARVEGELARIRAASQVEARRGY
jgi:hypothetical protein